MHRNNTCPFPSLLQIVGLCKLIDGYHFKSNSYFGNLIVCYSSYIQYYFTYNCHISSVLFELVTYRLVIMISSQVHILEIIGWVYSVRFKVVICKEYIYKSFSKCMDIYAYDYCWRVD